MKKLLSVVLVVAMVLSLSACSKGNDGGNAGNNGGDTFVIGGLGPLTGSAASYGTSVKQGAEVAVKEINAAGGVKVGDKTYTLSLNFLDDEASEDTAVTAYGNLMDKGINALLGGTTSGASIAVSELTKDDGILQITPSGSAMACTDYDNVFRVCFTDPLQGETLADYAAKVGYKKVAVLYNNSDEYSTGVMNAFVERAKANGIEIVANEAFADKDVDFKTQLTNIKNTDAEALFVPAYYEADAYIAKQAKDAGMTLPLFGSDGWDGVIKASTDTTALEGVVFLSPFLATADSAKNFTAAYEEAYKATPDQFAADSYDTVYVIKAAMEKAGSIENAALIAAMTEIEVDGLTGQMTFDASGEPNKGANFVKIVNGEYTAYTQE